MVKVLKRSFKVTVSSHYFFMRFVNKEARKCGLKTKKSKDYLKVVLRKMSEVPFKPEKLRESIDSLGPLTI